MGLFKIHDTLQLSEGLVITRTAVTSATYTLLETDVLIAVTYTTDGAVELTLPTAQVSTAGKTYIITDEGGNSSINNITIKTEGSETISEEETQIINADHSAMWIYSDGTNWFVF